jgi:hypothetical protein
MAASSMKRPFGVRLPFESAKFPVEPAFLPREIRWNSAPSPATLVKQMEHPTFIA